MDDKCRVEERKERRKEKADRKRESISAGGWCGADYAASQFLVGVILDGSVKR